MKKKYRRSSTRKHTQHARREISFESTFASVRCTNWIAKNTGRKSEKGGACEALHARTTGRNPFQQIFCSLTIFSGPSIWFSRNPKGRNRKKKTRRKKTHPEHSVCTSVTNFQSGGDRLGERQYIRIHEVCSTDLLTVSSLRNPRERFRYTNQLHFTDQVLVT